MKACIYGAGSLGTILGAYITKNGGEIDLINRNKAHVEALNKNGAKRKYYRYEKRGLPFGRPSYL